MVSALSTTIKEIISSSKCSKWTYLTQKERISQTSPSFHAYLPSRPFCRMNSYAVFRIILEPSYLRSFNFLIHCSQHEWHDELLQSFDLDVVTCRQCIEECSYVISSTRLTFLAGEELLALEVDCMVDRNRSAMIEWSRTMRAVS